MIRWRPARRWLATGIVSAVAVLAASCGPSSGLYGRSAGRNGVLAECPADALATTTEPTNVVVWHSYVGKTKIALEQLAAEYNAAQSKVHVELQVQGQSYEQLLRKVQQSGDADLPAIAVLEDTQTQAMADSGRVLSAQSCIDRTGYRTADLNQQGVAYYSIGKVLWPGSANLASSLLYYNREHFRRAGLDPERPPGTLEEVYQAARKLKEAGVTQQPFVLNLQPWFVEFWLTGAGASIVNNDNGRGSPATASAYDNPQTRQLFDWLVKMKNEGLLNAVPGTEGQVNHYFAIGLQQASMTVETSTAVTTINAVLEGTLNPADLGLAPDAQIPKIEIDVGVGLFPGLREPGKGQVGGGVWYMTNTLAPAVQAGAWDFIRFMNRPESQVTWNLEGSYLPFNDRALEDPELQADWRDTRKGRWLATAWQQLQGVNPAFPGPLIGPYTEVRAAIRKGLDNVVFSGQSPDQAITQTSADIDAALKAYTEQNF